MSDTPANIVNTVLFNLGNLDNRVFGEAATGFVNDALLELGSSLDFSDYRAYQKTATYSVAAGSGSSQTVALTNWATDIWSPSYVHNLTDDLEMRVYHVKELDRITGAAVSLPTGVAFWEGNMVIAPAFSSTKNIQIRYFSTQSRFGWDANSFTATGSNPLPNELDEGLKLGGTYRLAMIVNPALHSMWKKRFDDWVRSRVSQVEADILTHSHYTATPRHITMNRGY